MRHQTQYNENTTLEYEHLPLNTSNPVTGVKYLTKVYLFIPPNKRYHLGNDYGKLDDTQVKILFEETLNAKEREREYGQQSHTDRRLLSPIRSRGKVGTPAQQLAHQHGIRR